MKYLMSLFVVLAFASVANAATLGLIRTPNPAPTLRPATPGEIPNQCAVEKGAFVKAMFGGLAVPPQCSWSVLSPVAGCSRFNLKLTCEPMVLQAR